MTLRAIVPVNRLDRAKGRLAGVLTPDERRTLSLLTLDAVVEAAIGAGLEVVVVTPDVGVRDHLAGRAAAVMDEDPALRGLNAQLARALQGLDDAVILHADLPLAAAEALEAFLAGSLPAPSITVAPSGDGGTNVMRLRPPGLFELAYGFGSCALHVAAAKAAGMGVAIVETAGLAMDLDQPGDLVALLSSAEGRECPAGRYLRAIGLLERLEP